uniref:uncharacterized protein LOC122607569 n=1 Tax=Erigeron canadensis TaxID=72917 RepID=UPI001CB9AD55|nr:uncharacterized protein LOC122607569 [Erigeron canadensis]
MKFFQSSSSETQLSDVNCIAQYCLPRVLRCLPCFNGHATHQRIKESTEICYTPGNPGVVAKLMGLDSIPQRVIRSVDHQKKGLTLNTRSQPMSKTPMVLELKKGKLLVLGYETGSKGKEDSRSSSKRKLLDDDGSKKKKLLVETSNAKLAHELEFYDQLLLELVYIF